MLRTLVVLLPLLLARPAEPQSLRWDIPHRGAHVFTRDTIRFAVEPPPAKSLPTVVLQNGRDPAPHSWRFLCCTAATVPPNCERPQFDDHLWAEGRGGFGPTDQAHLHTAWGTEVVCLRTRLDVGKKKPKALWFRVDHDDGVRIWLNGKLIVADDGYGHDRWYVAAGDALDALQDRDNLLAVRCTNTGGAQHLDVQVSALHSLPAGVRNGEDLLRTLDDERKATNRVQSDLFGAYRCPPMLLQGELRDGRVAGVPPVDLRDFGWWLATDLEIGALGGVASLDALRVYGLGDVRLRGRAGPIEPDGWQTMEVTVKTSKDPAPGKDSNRFVDRQVKRFMLYALDGTLKVRRKVEIGEAGARVTEFETDFAGDLTGGKNFKDPAAHVVQREHWRLTRTHHNQDTEFRLAVLRAIERGTAKLRDQIQNPDAPSLKAQKADGPNSYHSGRLAIALLALLKGGIPHDDPVVTKALDALRDRPLIDTYSLGNALMVMDAFYAPHGELDSLRSGALDRPSPRQLPTADRERMQRWTDRLLTNIDTRVDPGYLLRFNYTADGRFDNSVHQYGLLGLYAAHLCGIDVATSVWEAAANHLLDAHVDGGDKVTLELTDYRTWARMQAEPDVPFTTVRNYARADGWGYHGAKEAGDEAGTWGSMTCAGITGLAICQAGLNAHPEVRRVKVQNDADRARNDGFAWLAENMTVRHHPGVMHRQYRWHYYYLYSLERAALLSGVALIQDRDWYFEGALMLVLAQDEAGEWPGERGGDEAIERNAMAVLFLKQSTSPVLTGR